MTWQVLLLICWLSFGQIVAARHVSRLEQRIADLEAKDGA